jgi:hypothetical protein
MLAREKCRGDVILTEKVSAFPDLYAKITGGSSARRTNIVEVF